MCYNHCWQIGSADYVGIGICQGMMPLVAYNYASGNHKRMDGVIGCARKLGLLVAAVSIVCYELFAPVIVRFFISDAATVALSLYVYGRFKKKHLELTLS